MVSLVSATVFSPANFFTFQNAVNPLVRHWQALREGSAGALLPDQAFASAVQNVIRERDALGYESGKPEGIEALRAYAEQVERQAAVENAPRFPVRYAEDLLSRLNQHGLIPTPGQDVDVFCATLASRLAKLASVIPPSLPLSSSPAVRFSNSLPGDLPVVTDFNTGALLVWSVSEDDQDAVTQSRYRPLRKLGSGAFGSVFSGCVLRRDRETGRWPAFDANDPSASFQKVALKFNTGASREMVDREIEALEWVGEKSLNFPRLIDSGFAVGRDGEQLDFIVMSLIKGRTFRLSDYAAASFNADGEPDRLMAKLLGVFDQVAGILEELGEEFGLVHKDLKPDNFMTRDADGRTDVKLIDLGCASERGEEWKKIAGTLFYLPDECLADSHVSHPSQDIFALGVMMYEALAGEKPFQPDPEILGRAPTDKREKARQFLDTIFSLKKGMAEGPRPIDGDKRVPPVLEELIRKILSKDPARRPSAQRIRFTLKALRVLHAFDRAQRAPAGPHRVRSIKTALAALATFQANHGYDRALIERAERLQMEIATYCLTNGIVV